MIVRTIALLSLIVSLQPSLAAAAETRQLRKRRRACRILRVCQTRHGSAETDVWPEHALPDADAARQGRSVLPFTQQQIETLGRLLRQTQRASARGRGRAAARPDPADPSRWAGRRTNPGDRAQARLHHGAFLHRYDRRALADHRDRARQPLPAAGPGGRGGSRRAPAICSISRPNKPISTATRW